MRLRLVLLLSVGLLVLSSSDEDPRPVLGQAALVTATRVALDPHDPTRRKAGALTYLGGVRLTSPDPAFGGFSSMLVSGDRVTLLSDGGNLVQFRIGPDWQPRETVFADLRDGPGTGRLKRDRDSESMTTDHAGHVWVGFEGANEIWRYDSRLATSDRNLMPEPMGSWDQNGGAESFVRLASGAFVILSETTRCARGGRQSLHYADDPTDPASAHFGFCYVPPKGYDPSDMTELPDGRLLVVNRRVSLRDWFTAKLSLVDPGTIRPGATVTGRVIATLAAPLLHDNFEAVAAMRERGATILWLATDDNRLPLQQSLLLKFRLDLPTAR